MIIGLAGFAKTGKDTVGHILVKNFGYHRLAFADAIRKFLLAIDPYVWSDIEMGGVRVSTMIPLNRTDSHSWEAAKSMTEVRRLLQVTGSEGGREVLGKDIWLDIVINQIKADATRDYVVTDCRFKNECEAIQDLGGRVLRVTKDGVGPPNQHSSELDILSWPYDGFIENDGSIIDLEKTIIEKVKELHD